MSNIYFLHIFYFEIQNRTKQSIMGNYYSTDHIAENHIHTDIEEPEQKYRLEKTNGEGVKHLRCVYVGGGGLHVLPDPNPHP